MTHINRFKLLAAAAVVAGTSMIGRPAEATTATAAMAVSATALAVCVIAATPMVFGNYSQAALSASASLAVTCTPNTTYAISLDGGTTSGGTQSARKMNNILGGTLPYSLYTDAGHASPWTSNTVSGTGTGLLQTINVYGLIPANQSVTAGAYTDVVTATLTY